MAAVPRIADPSLLLSDEGISGGIHEVPPTLVRPTLVKFVVAHRAPRRRRQVALAQADVGAGGAAGAALLGTL